MLHLKCHFCHKRVPRYDYTRHVDAHFFDDVTGSGHLQSDASDINYYGYDEGDYSGYSYAESDFRDRDTTFTVPRAPALLRMASPRTSARTAVNRTTPNAFQIWFENFKPDSPEYTMVDGQKNRNSDSETEEFIQNAKVLRDTSKGEVVKNVKEFKGFSDSEREACLELVRKVPIFPGLVAYVYTHLVKCPPRGWFWDVDWCDRVPNLKQFVEWWNEDGDIKCILSCNVIKKKLLEFLRCDAKDIPDKHKCNPALLNGTTMLNCDTRNLTAVAALCITEQQKGKLLLLQRGVQAERLVELFHSLLEVDVRLEERYWRCFFKVLVMFSRECGYCPRGIYLADDSISDLSEAEAQGGFSKVSKGKIGSRLVAMKVLKRKVEVGWSEYKKVTQELSKEAIVWRHLCHPNCLPLYGVYRMPDTKGYSNVALVSPWMEKGTLADYLKKNSENSEPNRTRLMLDVVRGLNYLHSMKPHIAHRDIKPQNILITNDGRACLAEFGLVSVFDVDLRPAADLRGTPPYMAPEMLLALKSNNEDAKRRVNSRACDMYALGCTIYVVYTDNLPEQVQVDLMSDKLPLKISADMWSFVQNLCYKDPSKRLTAEMAVSWMEEKARLEGADASPASVEEGWEWKGPTSSDKCLWSV